MSRPAYQRVFKGKPIYFFVDATTCHPTSQRVKWVTHEGAWPSVLNETFASIWSAATYVAEKTDNPENAARAWAVIQRESGITSDVFDFARHPWLDFFHTPDNLTHVVDSIPPHFRDTVDRFVTYEACSRAHVQEYDKYLKGRLASSAHAWSAEALTEGRPHYPFTYVPMTLPNEVLPPDVVACETFAHWLFERAQLGPLAVYQSNDQLLWVSRTGGPRNPNASGLLGQDVQGEAWAVSVKPVFPTGGHGPDARRKQVQASGRGRGRARQNGPSNRGRLTRSTAHAAQVR